VGKYIYTYIENGQMYDKSPSFAELLAKEGLSCEKIVTGRIGYICVEDFAQKIKDAKWLVFTSKNAVAGFVYNMGEMACEGVPNCDGALDCGRVGNCNSALNCDSVWAESDGVLNKAEAMEVCELESWRGSVGTFDVRSGLPDGVKIAVVGSKTNEALKMACGLEANFVSLQATGMDLGKKLMNIAAGKVVYVCAEVTSGSLEEAMKDYSELVKIPVYRNEYVDTYAEYKTMDYSDVSGIVVTSGSSGERIKWLIDKLGEVPVYSIGPACSRKLVEAGVPEKRIIEAGEHTYNGLVEVISC